MTLVLYEIEVIQSDSERIGDPVSLSLTDITNNDDDKNFPGTINDNNAVTKKSGFSTRIYRKPTYTRLLTKWSSFVPHFYKVSVISNMVYRAIRICSDYHLLHEEFEFITDVSLQNGYPLRFVESQIRKTLNRTYEVKNKSATNSSKVTLGKEQGKKNNILVEIPYVGAPTSLFGKQLARIGQEINPNSCIQIITKPPMTVGNYFSLKDPIPKNLCSRIIYHIKCLDCDAAYIGKTIRQATRRLKEHGDPLNQNSGITSTTLSQI